MSKIKVAYCLYGQPRRIHDGFKSINDLVEKFKDTHEFDFFFHTWYDPNLVGKHYISSNYRHISQSELLVNENTINDLVRLYSPKKYEYEPPIQFYQDENFDKSDIMNSSNRSDVTDVRKNNTLCYLYTNFKVKELLNAYCNETGTKYSFIISSRFDFLNNINIDLNIVNPQKIYAMPVGNRLYICSNLVICGPEIYNNFANAFININQIMNNVSCKQIAQEIGCGFCFVSEAAMTCNLILFYNIKDVLVTHPGIPDFH